MATLEIKDSKGKAVGKMELGSIGKSEPLMHLLHKAVVTEEANRRQGTQKTKTRSEVSGGGRKLYKQKKTGNARQGSTRSPQWAHGAMALALSPRDYTKGFNKKERRAAIRGALVAQVNAGNVIVVEKINFDTPKTKSATDLLTALGVIDTRRVLVITKDFDEATYKCFRNLPNVEVRTAPSTEEGAKTSAFSTRDVLVAHKIVVDKAALDQIEAVWGTEEGKVKAEKVTKVAKVAKPAKAEKVAIAVKEDKPAKAAPKAKPAAKKAEATEEKPKRATKKKTEEGEN